MRQLLADFHSIKGSSAALQFNSVKIICHKAEDLFQSEVKQDLKNQVNEWLIFCDAIKDYFNIFLENKSINEDEFISKNPQIFQNLIKRQKKEIPQIIFHIPLNILIVGLSQSIVKNFKRSLPDFSLHFSFTDDSLNALERLAKEKFDLVLTSYFTIPLTGVTLCMTFKNQWPNLKTKFVIFPSQELELNNLKGIDSLLPDKIILKNQDMYNEFREFVVQVFGVRQPIKKILFLDDDKDILSIYEIAFEDIENIEKKFLLSDENWLKNVQSFSPDLIISDVNMPHVDLLELLSKYQMIFVSGGVSKDQSNFLLQHGALGIFEKNIITEDLPKLISQSIFKK